MKKFYIEWYKELDQIDGYRSVVNRDMGKVPVDIVDRSISQTLSAKFDSFHVLSWSHYVFLMTIDDRDERKFYEMEAYRNSWSLRELKRQFGSSLYERLAMSRDRKGIKEMSLKGQII